MEAGDDLPHDRQRFAMSICRIEMGLASAAVSLRDHGSGPTELPDGNFAFATVGLR